MELRHLTYFKRVAELEQITKAADELFISQAHLSRIIGELESELGVLLFDRQSRGIVLNACGKVFYEKVVEILGAINDAKTQVNAAYQRQQSQVRVITNAGAYMPGLLLRLAKAAPNLKLQQYSAPRTELIRRLREGSVDFAICCPPIDDKIAFESTPLRREPAVVICPREHWLEGEKSVSIQKLRNEKFISVAQGYGARDAVEVLYQAAGMVPNFIIETGDTNSVQRYVREGLGIAIVPEALIRQEEYFGDSYIKLDEDAGGELAISWRHKRVFSESDEIFYRAAVEYFDGLSQHEKGVDDRKQPGPD